MAKDPAFQFYAKDWLVDTKRWTPEMKALHIDLLCEAWINGWPEVDEKDENFPKNLSKKEKKSFKLISEKWKKVGNYFINEKMEKVKQERKEYIENQVLNGKLGGRPKRLPFSENNPSLSETESQMKAKQNPEITSPTTTTIPYTINTDKQLTTTAQKIFELLKKVVGGFDERYLNFRALSIASDYEGKQVRSWPGLVNTIAAKFSLDEQDEWLVNNGLKRKPMVV